MSFELTNEQLNYLNANIQQSIPTEMSHFTTNEALVSLERQYEQYRTKANCDYNSLRDEKLNFRNRISSNKATRRENRDIKIIKINNQILDLHESIATSTLTKKMMSYIKIGYKRMLWGMHYINFAISLMISTIAITIYYPFWKIYTKIRLYINLRNLKKKDKQYLAQIERLQNSY